MAESRRLSAEAALAGDSLQGRKCVVALSGGPDSAALGWLAQRFADEVRFVHVNHGLPGSGQMESAARSVAATFGGRLGVISVHVPEGPSPEAQARTARYRVLLEALRPGEVLVTGHTADDVAETILINLGRGTGLAGLAGIPEQRGPIMRPLLRLRRSEVLALARAQSLPYSVDPANTDTGFLRNRIRHDVLPGYEKALERDPVPGLTRTAALAGEAFATIEAAARSVPIVVQGGVARTPLIRLAIEAAAIQTEVVRRLIRAVRPPYPPSAAEVGRVLAVARGETGTELEGRIVVSRSRTNLLIGPQPGRPPDPALWGDEIVEFEGWRLRKRLVESAGRRLATGMACFVPDTGGELVVRAVQVGDAFPIPGGTKAVSAAIAEAGTPRPARSRYPVVACDGVVVWIPGVRATSVGWEERASGRYLLLDIIEEGPWK